MRCKAGTHATGRDILSSLWAVWPVVFWFGAARVASRSAYYRACDQVVIWSLPHGLILNKTKSDSRDANTLGTQARINGIALAATAYCYAHKGEYPLSLGTIIDSSPTAASMPERCRAEGDWLTDFWGHPIYYGVIDGRLVIQSAGPDGIFATSDDIGLPTVNDPLAEIAVIRLACR